METISFAKKVSCILLMGSTLSGCLINHLKSDYRLKGNGDSGYTDLMLNKHTAWVSFTHDDSVLAERYLIRRAAEVAWLRGFRFFTVDQQKTEVRSRVIRTPSEIRTRFSPVESRSILLQPHERYSTVDPGIEYEIKTYTLSATIHMMDSNQRQPNAYEVSSVLANFQPAN